MRGRVCNHQHAAPLHPHPSFHSFALDRMKPKIRVALVEDNAELRRQLQPVLAQAPGFECTGVFADAESALAALPANPPDVVLMDIQLPRMSGVECVARLKALLPAVNVVMFTVY